MKHLLPLDIRKGVHPENEYSFKHCYLFWVDTLSCLPEFIEGLKAEGLVAGRQSLRKNIKTFLHY